MSCYLVCHYLKNIRFCSLWFKTCMVCISVCCSCLQLIPSFPSSLTACLKVCWMTVVLMVPEIYNVLYVHPKGFQVFHHKHVSYFQFGADHGGLKWAELNSLPLKTESLSAVLTEWQLAQLAQLDIITINVSSGYKSLLLVMLCQAKRLPSY